VADGRPEAKGVLRVRALDRQTGRLIDSFQPPDLARNKRFFLAGNAFFPAGNGFCALAYRTVRCYNPSSGLFRLVARTRGVRRERPDFVPPAAQEVTAELERGAGFCFSSEAGSSRRAVRVRRRLCLRRGPRDEDGRRVGR